MYKEIEENNQKIIDYSIVLRVQKDWYSCNFL
jgi:hypothetical protein